MNEIKPPVCPALPTPWADMDSLVESLWDGTGAIAAKAELERLAAPLQRRGLTSIGEMSKAWYAQLALKAFA